MVLPLDLQPDLSLSYLADWVPKDSAKREACELPMSPVKTIELVFQFALMCRESDDEVLFFCPAHPN